MRKGRRIEGTKERRFARKELAQILAFCLIPTHLWTVINLFQDVPAWALALSAWDMIGTIAYTLVAVLIESLALFALIVGIGYIVPRKWIGERYSSLSGYILIELSIFAVIASHYIQVAMARKLLPYALILLLCIGLTVILIVRTKVLHREMSRLAGPLTVLAGFYVFFDLISLAIVGIRLL